MSCFLEYCPQGWIQHGGSCYVNYVDPRSWLNAEAHCREFGAYQVRIDSFEENDFIARHMIAPDSKGWIGLRGIGNEFRWSEGSQLQFVNWEGGENKNIGEGYCVQMLTESVTFGWEAISCRDENPYVCEKGL